MQRQNPWKSGAGVYACRMARRGGGGPARQHAAEAAVGHGQGREELGAPTTGLVTLRTLKSAGNREGSWGDRKVQSELFLGAARGRRV